MNARIKWLRNQLVSLKLEGMIVSNPINVRYLTGLSEEGFLIIGPKENVFVTDSRFIESVNKKLTLDDEIIAYDRKELIQYDYENMFNRDDNVGFEEKYLTYDMYKNYMRKFQVNLVETDELIEKARSIKDEEEIENIKKACKITDDAFQYVIRHIKKDMTEKEVAFEVEKYMITHGADSLAFESIVAFGENSSMPHAVPTDRKIKSGDIIQFDIGCKVNGYCSDFSRVVFVDEVKEEYRAAYEFVLEEQKILRTSLRDGVNIKQIMKSRELEYDMKNYSILHAFGHSLGLEIHESPVLASRQDSILKENTVIAIEPGVYELSKFGVRIEDTFLVTKAGCDSLTTSSRDYIVINLI